MSVLARRIPSYFLPIAVATLVLAACGKQPPAGGFPGFPPGEVTTITVAPRNLPVAYEYVGQTAGSKEVEVRARVTGILEQKLYQEGSAVRVGQVLFVIDPKPLAAQAAALEAELARAQAGLAQSNRELARLKPLAEKRAVGQKEADDAASNAELSAASVKAAQAKLDEVKLSLGYTRVVAPIAGLSSRAPKSEGSLVTANDTLLTTISQANPIWVPFAISENEQLALNKSVSEGRLTLPKDNAYNVSIKMADGSVVPRKGRINFADSRINPATGTFEMRAELPNADGVLKPGQFVRVTLEGAMRNNALAVPQVAVLDGAQGKFVYVADKDKDGKDIAAARPVTVGPWVVQDGVNLWIIDSGIKAGDKVITDGVSKLRPGAPIKLVAAPAAAPGNTAPAAAPGNSPGNTAPAAPAAPAAPKS